LIAAAAGALALPPPSELTSEQQARIRWLESRLIAPCCWSETIATHRSEIALQMKLEVARLVAEGKTDREILDRYKQRYGMRVLVEPEGSRRWVMNVVPVVAVLLGLAFTLWVMRRWLRSRAVREAGV
jgi:cytochrome c-type biogenesis protein CcmH